MSAEIRDWLAEVTAAESVAATDLGAALVVLTEATELPGQPLVTDLNAELGTAPPDGDDPRYAVDCAYQQLLEDLQQVRREVADAASYRTMRRQRFRHFGDGRPDVIDELPLTEQELAAAAEREQELTARSQRMQQDVDAFRTAKETAKAMYTAAEASRNVHAAMAAVEHATARSSADAAEEDPGLADLDRAIATAAVRLQELATQAARTRRNIRGTGRPDEQQRPADPTEPASEPAVSQNHDDAPVPGLLELRADPLGTDIRVLLAVEPAGTATLLAVLDSADAISDYRDEAISLAGLLLTEIRDGNWPPPDTEGTETGEVCFDDAGTLLTTMFPDRGAAIRARAAELAEISTLAALRRASELTIADLAASANLNEQRVWEIEHAGLRSVDVQEAAAYVRALGGRLDLTADFGPAGRTSLS
ncbi:MAG: PspA/IM30 family protein [Streptosporangiaceae bacterium]